MTYCYQNEIEVPEDQEDKAAVLRKACEACGHGDQAKSFLEWYFDEDNDSVFVTIDYGEEGLAYGYPPTDGNANRG